MESSGTLTRATGAQIKQRVTLTAAPDWQFGPRQRLATQPGWEIGLLAAVRDWQFGWVRGGAVWMEVETASLASL